MTKRASPHRVLFTCAGNTCRSVFAEHLARACCDDTVAFESAGIAPQSAADAEKAIHTLQQVYKIDASGHVPRGVQSVDLDDYDVIIALDEPVAERIRAQLGAGASKLQVWETRDPWGGDLADYETCSREIEKRVIQLRQSLRGG